MRARATALGIAPDRIGMMGFSAGGHLTALAATMPEAGRAGAPFQTGRHGSGLGLGDAALDAWPSLLEAWMRGRGLFAPDPAVMSERKRLLSPPEARQAGAPFTVDLPLRDLLGSAAAKQVRVTHLGEHDVLDLGTSDPEFRFSALRLFDPDRADAAVLEAVDADLRALPR